MCKEKREIGEMREKGIAKTRKVRKERRKKERGRGEKERERESRREFSMMEKDDLGEKRLEKAGSVGIRQEKREEGARGERREEKEWENRGRIVR